MSEAAPAQATGETPVFHTEFGVRVEVLDVDAYLSGYGVVRCRRIEDGEFISVPAKELVPVNGLSEADQPRELFAHAHKIKKEDLRIKRS